MGLQLNACIVTELSNLCKLLNRVDGALEPLVTAFEEHVKKKGMQRMIFISCAFLGYSFV